MNLTFDYIGEINDANLLTLINYINANSPQDIDSLKININSTGGAVSSGVALYNYLKALPFDVITHNMGEVSSAAILMYLAGSTRTAESDCKFTIHPLAISVGANLPYFKVEELLQGIDADINLYKDIVIKETNNLSNKYNVEELLKSSSLVLTPTEAQVCGLITDL